MWLGFRVCVMLMYIVVFCLWVMRVVCCCFGVVLVCLVCWFGCG